MRASIRLAGLLQLGLCLAGGMAGQAQSSTATQKQSVHSVVYVNRQYGFRFSLPADWAGYAIVMESWSGDGRMTGVGGPMLLIRHPLWTKESPRRDIPIMIFTRAQWKLLQEGKLTVSAAPYDPGEIGRNGKYVFAIPPRYNFDEEPGHREVIEILDGHPLHAF